METLSIPQRGVERHKAPTLADDGGSIECINLRPSADGLDLAHDKKHLFTSQFGADSIDDNITAVYRHRALPENWFVVVLNKRKMVVFSEKDGRMSPTVDDKKNIVYFAKYEDDILNIGELNNVLVVRTASTQDFYLWDDMGYKKMPEIKMPRSMSLTQDFNSKQPGSPNVRPFFQVITSFDIPFMNSKWSKNGEKDYEKFSIKFKQNKDRCLQFIQGLRAEQEANQRKLGKFVGHVLVRCAFKTAQGNYVSYGSVLHSEIGSWAAAYRTSKFPISTDEEKKLPYYQKLYGNIIRAYAPLKRNNSGNWKEESNSLQYDTADKGNTACAPIPVASFRACLYTKNYNAFWGKNGDANKHPVLSESDAQIGDFEYRHDAPISGAGFSQLPVWVGAIPAPVWETRSLRGVTNNNSIKRKHYAGIKERSYVSSIGTNDWDWLVGYSMRGRSDIGVYAPSIHYSYPILRIEVDKEFIATLEYYRETGIIESFCIAMTAPVKNGVGTTLYKNYTRKKDGVCEGYGTQEVDNDNDDDDDENDTWDDVSGEAEPTPGNTDYLYSYGYTFNPDVKPENLMNRNFYIVKDINLTDLLKTIRESKPNDTGEDVFTVEIPIQLKEIGAKETEDGVILDNEEIADSQEEQIDPNRVSLSNIESAKPLPTDSFSTHALLGSSFMEYNRRLHLLGVSVLMSEGFTPTSPLQYDQDGFGSNKIVKRGDQGFVDNIYMEYILKQENKTMCRRVPIDAYLTNKDGDNIIMNDILTYPDYRCKTMRLVIKIGERYHLVGEEIECKSSVLNNLAYAANTLNGRDNLPVIKFKANGGLVVHEKYVRRDGGRDELYQDKINSRYLVNKKSEDGWPIQNELCAYKDEDFIFYAPRIVELSGMFYHSDPIDYSGIDDSGWYEDSNRVQVSETDDVFSYPAVNSYRAGSIENKIISGNSVYGQVTEQKFGMFPLYLFTKEGIFTMEQGTGNILYSNVSKINDDVLSDKRSICNAGDMVAYATLDGLRIIQGRESQQVSDLANGMPFIDLHGDNSPFLPTVSEIPGQNGGTVSFAEYLSRVRLADEIQGCEMLWDSYNKEVVLLCRQGDRAVTWAYNVASQQMYKRKDILNDRKGFGVVLNGKNLVWCGRSSAIRNSQIIHTFLSSGGQENIIGGVIEEENPDLGISGRIKGFDIYDFNSSDQETETDGSADKQQFLYVSNPIKAGSVGYKHIEHSVLRMFGHDLDMAVEYYGSLDGRKWFRMGGGRISEKEEYSDMLMRRMPCSTRYIVVVIKGNAAKLQINRLEAEVQARYAKRLR